MQNFSDNWRQLKGILAAYAPYEQQPDFSTLADHLHAKAMSIFIVNASLATPSLDRTTVANVLSGVQSWPRDTDSGRFHGVSVPLSFFEENGFVSFYAGWCSVHCRLPRKTAIIDPTLTGLIEAVEHLGDIHSGRNGCVQPHYESPAQLIDELISTELGVAVEEVLPDLQLEDCEYHLPPGNKHFSPLVCTYLWRTLSEQDPLEAFGRWITALRVNCGHAMPPVFELLTDDERSAFNGQLLAWLADDKALWMASETLQKQFINEHTFESIVSPTSTHMQIDIDLSGASPPEREKIIELELAKPTISSLASAYPVQSTEGLSDFQSVRQWNQYQRHYQPGLFYTGLVGSALEGSIRIEGHSLTSSDFSEALLELAATRPVLKYLLFHSLANWYAPNFRLCLLSRHQTSAIALFHLTEFRHIPSDRRGAPSVSFIEKGYQQLVFHEFVRAIEKEPDIGDRLLEVVEYLSERINLTAPDFSQQPEYLLLLDALNGLSHQHVLELGRSLIQYPSPNARAALYRSADHHRYLLGFWLVDRLDNTGIDTAGELGDSLRKHLFIHYKAEFEACIAGSRESLQPTSFFSALPWQKLFESDGSVGTILALAANWTQWIAKLEMSNEKAFRVASTIRQFLQVLMNAGKRLRAIHDRQRIARGVMELVRHLGFGDRTDSAYLFNSALYFENFDLWKSFCTYTNDIDENLFDDFIEQRVTFIPMDQLYVFLERSIVVARAQKLQSEIDKRSSSDSENMGLTGLEQTFISACDAGNMPLAEKVLLTANERLTEPRFSKSTHHLVVQWGKKWTTYEYKWKLLDQSIKLHEDPDAFVGFARALAIPHEIGGGQFDVNSKYWRECDYFRRYVIAAVYLNSEPEKCVRLMEPLCKESDDENFRFLLFRGRVAAFEKNQDNKISSIADLRRAISQFFDAGAQMAPGNMSIQWTVVILNAYRLLHDMPLMNAFWEMLTVDQQSRAEILYPFCKAQIADGNPHIAKQLITNYLSRNHQAVGDLGLTLLLDEVAKALPSDFQLSSVVNMMVNAPPRSKFQLARDYSEIVSKDFPDYVDIVGEGRTPEEFLKDVVEEIANELLLRKKNLLIHMQGSDGNENSRLTKEDLVNDWFTSLFNKRMANARIGFEDQKRAGVSQSGDGPGEVDGYIVDAQNRNIAIFEAFRLFSADTTVIFEHLDKIAGYDNEALSPVFIAAYCDVRNFNALVRSYIGIISARNYVGYTPTADADNCVTTLKETDQLWIGLERRLRGQREIAFYHMLLNFR